MDVHTKPLRKPSVSKLQVLLMHECACCALDDYPYEVAADLVQAYGSADATSTLTSVHVALDPNGPD